MPIITGNVDRSAVGRDPAIEQCLGQPLVDGFGGFFHAFMSAGDFARDDQRTRRVEQHGIAVSAGLAM